MPVRWFYFYFRKKYILFGSSYKSGVLVILKVSYVQNYFIKITYFKNLSIKGFLAFLIINTHLNNLLRTVVFNFFFKTLLFNLNKYSFKYVVVFLLIFKKIKKIYNKNLNVQLLNLSALKTSKNIFFIKQNQQISFFIFNKNYLFNYILFFFKRLINHNSLNLRQQLFFKNWNYFSFFSNMKNSDLIKIFILF